MVERLDANNLAWVEQIPMLDDLQAGSLKRIFDLAAQLPDDWSGMMGRSTLQEDFGSLRFQLAYMSYALALTHVHRLPAAPALFRRSFDQLIQKILSPDVWTYWHYVGTGNGPFNRALGELPATWNPVERDNIMYSGYVQSMALLYHYLFRDDKYAKEGALTFSVKPLFWGMGGQHFAYDERSLNELIYWKMVQGGYLGIACEPNCVFQVCNQIPILGFRFHDLVYGGSLASEVTDGYLKAWEEFGMLDDSGHYRVMVQEHERAAISFPDQPWVDFWLASLMHAWNPDMVNLHYPDQLAHWSVAGPDGTLSIKPTIPSNGSDRYTARDFGWAAVCASEVGDSETLSRLLAYADRFLHPTWSEGAYFYRRHDQLLDADGNFAAMDPHTGNALLAYARLNVPGGLQKLFAGPLGDSHFEQPALVDCTQGLDVRRAWFESERNALVLTVVNSKVATAVRLEVGNTLGRGNWRLLQDGKPSDAHSHLQAERLIIEFELEGETTLVLSWV